MNWRMFLRNAIVVVVVVVVVDIVIVIVIVPFVIILIDKARHAGGPMLTLGRGFPFRWHESVGAWA